MIYNFKALQELGWAVFTAAAVTIGQLMFVFKPEDISDWRLWAVTAAGALARAVGAAIITTFGKGRFIAE